MPLRSARGSETYSRGKDPSAGRPENEGGSHARWYVGLRRGSCFLVRFMLLVFCHSVLHPPLEVATQQEQVTPDPEGVGMCSPRNRLGEAQQLDAQLNSTAAEAAEATGS